ncbi:MAG: hypothetical protein AAF899_20100, partial [Pseudomonadota bacterium]
LTMAPALDLHRGMDGTAGPADRGEGPVTRIFLSVSGEIGDVTERVTRLRTRLVARPGGPTVEFWCLEGSRYQPVPAVPHARIPAFGDFDLLIGVLAGAHRRSLPQGLSYALPENRKPGEAGSEIMILQQGAASRGEAGANPLYDVRRLDEVLDDVATAALAVPGGVPVTLVGFRDLDDLEHQLERAVSAWLHQPNDGAVDDDPSAASRDPRGAHAGFGDEGERPVEATATPDDRPEEPRLRLATRSPPVEGATAAASDDGAFAPGASPRRGPDDMLWAGARANEPTAPQSIAPATPAPPADSKIAAVGPRRPELQAPFRDRVDRDAGDGTRPGFSQTSDEDRVEPPTAAGDAVRDDGRAGAPQPPQTPPFVGAPLGAVSTTQPVGAPSDAPVGAPGGRVDRTTRLPATPLSVPARGVQPFPGLAPFTTAQAAYFEGREDEAEDAARCFDDAVRRDCRFLLLEGASGVGTSSLMAAGVAPRLIRAQQLQGRPAPAVVTLSPGPTPADRLAEALAELDRDSGLILLLDRLERILEVAAPLQRDALTATLDALAATSDTTIIATARLEDTAALAERAAMQRLLSEGVRFRLEPISPSGLEDALTRPAKQAGFAFERRALDGRRLEHVLLQDAGGADALPLLALALQSLARRAEAA